MDPDFEVSLRVFTDKNSVVNGEMWNIYKMGDPEVEAFQKQRADYITKNWQKNPLDQRNLSMKRGFRYEDVPNRPYPPDSISRFQNAKMTKSQFDAMKKDVDAYKRKDMAALYESNDPVFSQWDTRILENSEIGTLTSTNLPKVATIHSNRK